jgi:hypothetical protein
MVKTKTRLGYEGSCVSVKGKLEAQAMTDHWGSEVQVEGLAPMDQGNYEEQVSLRSMDYEGHVKLWNGPYSLWKPSEDIKWIDEGKMEELHYYE